MQLRSPSRLWVSPVCSRLRVVRRCRLRPARRHPTIQPSMRLPAIIFGCPRIRDGSDVRYGGILSCETGHHPTGNIGRGGARVYALFRPPLPFAPGVCPARAPGSGGAPPWVGGPARELPLDIATQHIGYTPFGRHDSTTITVNVGFALGTMYRVCSYRGARVLRLSAVYVHCFRSHFGSRLRDAAGGPRPPRMLA